MKATPLALAEVLLLEPTVHADGRGFFLEAYNQRRLGAAGITETFVQDNLSRSRAGVLRGFHYQRRQTQAKLVMALRGRIVDAVVDVRLGSPTFGRVLSTVLDAEKHQALYIPAGFAHGFYALTDPVDLLYKCSAFHAPAEERGVLWSDPDLGVPWPLDAAPPLLSTRDAAFPRLRDLPPADLPRYPGHPAAAARTSSITAPTQDAPGAPGALDAPESHTDEAETACGS